MGDNYHINSKKKVQIFIKVKIKALDMLADHLRLYNIYFLPDKAFRVGCWGLRALLYQCFLHEGQQ